MNQDLALEIMADGHHVLLTGAAGSGKTYVLNEFIRRAKRSGKHVSVTATTGLAASHLGGNTIHAWSGMGIHDDIPHKFLDNLTKTRRDTITKTDVLIIDEVSMLHDFRLDHVDTIARMVRDNDQPFGGIQVILCGDFFQLPPITKGENTSGSFVVGSRAWEALDPVICYLEEQHRQEDDEFLEILSALRGQDLRRRHVEKLLARQKVVLDAPAITELHTMNVDVDAINTQKLSELAGKSHRYKMVTTGGEHYVETLKRSCLAHEVLELKEGALVMAIKNNQDRKYVNGSLGVVVGFADESDMPIVRFNTGREVTMGLETWELRDGTRKKASVAQIPLRLAWAITVHKSQGMTLDAARVDLRKAFVEGMGYVALSRVSGLVSLSLVGINRMALKISPEAARIDKLLQTKAHADAINFAHLAERAKNRPKVSAVRPKTVATGEWAEKLAKMRQQYPNAYRPWKSEDDEKLTKLYGAGKSVEQLTDIFQRHPGSIRARLKKLLGDHIFDKPVS